MPSDRPADHDALEEVIREEDFFPLLEAQGRPFFLLANTLIDLASPQWSKGHMFRLVLETNELESFLDDFGARKNRTFGFLCELVASLRWLAQTCFTLDHVDLRLESYQLTPYFKSQFQESFRKRLSLLKQSSLRVLKAILTQARKQGLHLPGKKLPDQAFSRVKAERYLPENLEEGSLGDEGKCVAELAARFLAAGEMIRAAFPLRHAPFTPTEMTNFISRFCREEQVRICQVSMHNLQSRYDTYIKGTAIEKETPTLVTLRGYIAMALHLLECATFLVHLDERHENDLRAKKTRQAVAKVVDRQNLVSTVIDFLIPQSIKVIREGAVLARAVLGNFTLEEQIDLRLPRGIFLHARPASLIVSVVNHYGMPIQAEIDGNRANASSIMAVMILAGQNPGARTIRFRGDQRVLKDLELLFSEGLRRDKPFPEQLDYLEHADPAI